MKRWRHTQEVEIIVLFPELHYVPKGMPPLQIRAQGKGSTTKAAICQAFRAAMEDPAIKHKSPNWIFVSIGAHMDPIPFHHFCGFPQSGLPTDFTFPKSEGSI